MIQTEGFLLTAVQWQNYSQRLFYVSLPQTFEVTEPLITHESTYLSRDLKSTKAYLHFCAQYPEITIVAGDIRMYETLLCPN